MTRKICSFAFLLLVTSTLACVLIGACKNQRRDDELIAENDQRVAADVQRRLIKNLQDLPASHSVTQRFGKFIQLLGSGYHRTDDFPGCPSIEMARTVRFQEADVRCLIRVNGSGALQFNLRLSPTPEWLAKNPQHRLVKQGDELFHTGPGVNRPSEFSVAVTHPEYANTIGELQQVHAWRTEADRAIDDFIAGTSGSESRRQAAWQWYDNQRSAIPVELFVRGLLERSNKRVRLEAIRLLRQPRPGHKPSLSQSVKRQLLSIIADANDAESVRSEAVRTMLKLYEPERKEVYQVLAQLGPEGHFAVPVIGEFLIDKTHRHWQAVGAGDAPTGAAKLLEQWGAASAAAAKPLMEVVENHPNRWDFAPAAVRALNAIAFQEGPSREVRQVLQLAATDSSASVREAAMEALEHFPAPIAPLMGAPIQFSKRKEREQFYPLEIGKTFTWPAAGGGGLFVLRSEEDGGGLYKIDVQTTVCRRLFYIAFDEVVAVTGQEDSILLLQMNEHRSKLSLDTWSLSTAERMDTKTLYAMRPIDAHQQTDIGNVVWSDDRQLVAFTQRVRTPHGRGHTESRFLQIKRLDSPDVRPDARLEEYLMTPIRFSADQSALFLHGWCFAEGARAIARLDLATGKITPVLKHATSFSMLPWQCSGHNWIPVQRQSSKSQPDFDLVEVDSRQEVTISPSGSPAHLNDPWEIAYAINASGEYMAVVMPTGINIYNTRSGEMVRRQQVLSPRSQFLLSPLMVAANRDGFVVAVTFQTGPQRTPPSAANELRVFQVAGLDPSTSAQELKEKDLNGL